MTWVAIELPLRIASEANVREAWQARARRAKEQRTSVQLGLRVPLGQVPFMQRRPGRPELLLRDPVVVTLTRVAPYTLDDDNLRGALKAVRDGVADALGLRSDRDPRVTWRYGQTKGPRPRYYACRVVIEPRTLEQERPRAGNE